MRKAYFYAPVICGLLLAACDDDDETEPTPTLTIAVGDPITIVAGQSGSTTITVTRGGGYDDEVDLSITGLPTGVTAVFAPQQIPAGSGPGTSTLTLTADATAVPGTAQFVIEAEATTRAGLVANATGSVTVNEAPGFSLAVDPATLEIAAGASGTSDVTITRTGGFAEAVNLTVENLPAGVTAEFDDAAPTGDAAVLTLTADATAAAGTSTITVSGAGTPGTETADIALTITAPEPAGFTLALDPAALTVAAASSGTSTVNLTRTGGFTGAVALTATGAPDGVTVSFNPASADAETSTATVSVGSAVAAGDYPIVIHGNADGLTEQTGTLTLTVGGTAATDFTLAVDPATLSVAAGANGTATVNITRTGTFTGPVALSVPDAPEGVTVAFDPASADGATSTATITVASTVAAGDYPIEIQGTASGQTTQTVTLTLTVTTTSASAGSLDRMTVAVGVVRLALATTESRR